MGSPYPPIPLSPYPIQVRNNNGILFCLVSKRPVTVRKRPFLRKPKTKNRTFMKSK